MIVLKLGDDLAAVCDRCLRCELGSFERSVMKTYPFDYPLLCKSCDKYVRSRREQREGKERGQSKEAQG